MREKTAIGVLKGGEGEMWRFKSCPKCKGDIYLEKDIDGWYERCLQCGYNRDLKYVVEVREQPTETKELATAGARKTTR